MNLLLETDLAPLLEKQPGPCISIYLSKSGAATALQQGPLRWRHLLARTTEELNARGLDEAAVKALLRPLAALEEDRSFWNAHEEGIAVFHAPGFTRVFHLPQAFTERSVVADHFFLKPLLPLVGPEETFYVLALSQNEARLLEAKGRTVQRIGVADLPRGLTGALGDQKTSQDLQLHSASAQRGPAQSAVYHGHGVGAGDAKDELRRYVHQVDLAVRKVLTGRTEPLVLAGAEPLPILYREGSGYPRVVREVIAGSPDLLRNEELCDRARQILEPGFHDARRRAAERFGELAGTGRASSDPAEILPAARHGRVESLFLACDADLWGRLDTATEMKLQVHTIPEEGDEELGDAAALFSLRHGGAVFGVSRGEVPGGGPLAAVFRY